MKGERKEARLESVTVKWQLNIQVALGEHKMAQYKSTSLSR